MLPKPKRLGPEHAAVFKDRSVAEAYPNRPPYLPEVFSLLQRLMVDTPRVVLELGCGTGEIARGLAPVVDQVDAGDPSGAMLEVGKMLPGGNNPTLRWHLTSAEEFDYPSTYALIVAAESLAWFDWEIVFPNMWRALSHNGRLVMLVRHQSAAWDAGKLGGIVPSYSTNRDFVPYDLLEELQKRRLFDLERQLTTNPVSFSQSLDDYIEFWHSRQGFSRERMGEEPAARFDEEVRRIVLRHSSNGMLQYNVTVEVTWGVPFAPQVW